MQSPRGSATQAKPRAARTPSRLLPPWLGALVLARTAATPQLRDEILGAARNKLLEAPRT